MSISTSRIASSSVVTPLLLALLAAAPAAAQVPAAPAGSEPAAPAAPVPAGPEDPYDRGTPRAAMLGFLESARAGDWQRAAEYLDLRTIPSAARAEQGPELARKLKLVLDRTIWVDVDALSADPAGAVGDGLARRDVAGRIDATTPPTPVHLERVAREDGVRIWKVAQGTVDEIPALWEEFGDSELLQRLPAPLREISILEIALWQWIALLLTGAGAVLAGVVLALLAARLLKPLFRHLPVLNLAVAPLTMLFALGLFSAAQRELRLAVPAQRAIDGMLHAGAVLAFTWLALRIVDLVEERAAQRLVLSGQPAGRAVIVLARRGAKAVIVLIAALVALQSFGLDVTALVAGLGVGGIAVALAAQKSLENLFGGLTIVADQPARVGDFCRFGDMVGIVEDIGLRSTRVRTLERSLVTIPNAEFASMQVDNYSRRDRFWYHPAIGLRYETSPDQLRYVLVAARELLYAHPRVDPSPARIRFTGFGASSLDLEIFAYVRARDYDDFLEVAEDLNLRLMDVVARAGTGFAFPSQTVYVRPDAGLDADTGKRAQEEVARWRERGELALPAFPSDRVERLAGTLDYPPKGSALRLAGT
jgi:MscS family membrane protein